MCVRFSLSLWLPPHLLRSYLALFGNVVAPRKPLVAPTSTHKLQNIKSAGAKILLSFIFYLVQHNTTTTSHNTLFGWARSLKENRVWPPSMPMAAHTLHNTWNCLPRWGKYSHMFPLCRLSTSWLAVNPSLLTWCVCFNCLKPSHFCLLF